MGFKMVNFCQQVDALPKRIESIAFFIQTKQISIAQRNQNKHSPLFSAEVQMLVVGNLLN